MNNVRCVELRETKAELEKLDWGIKHHGVRRLREPSWYREKEREIIREAEKKGGEENHAHE